MKIITTLAIACLMFCSSLLFAQNEHFTVHGTIEFEKTINMYALKKKQTSGDEDGFWAPLFDSYKKTQPQFKKLKSTLSFTDNKTLFKPIEPTESNDGFFSDMA